MATSASGAPKANAGLGAPQRSAPRASIKPTVTMADYVPIRDGGRITLVAPPWGPGARVLRICAARDCIHRATTQSMQFRIEITCETDISSKVIYRATIDEITSVRAKMKAAALLNLYAGRGANSARVLNPKNEVIFRL
jgi:hypothetical protein